jgi:hypothetical protein
MIDNTSLKLYNVSVSGVAPAGSQLVVELFVPDASPGTDRIFLGSNGLGQTGPSYIAAPTCGITEPLNMTTNWPNVHMVMSVSGDEGGTLSCDAPEDIPWLSLNPSSGSTPEGDSDDVEVTFDSTGLAAGDYEAVLCVNSNDQSDPVVEVPVTLTVEP